MARAAEPAQERERVEVLHKCGILDTPREREFEDLTSLAAKLVRTPVALISLIDSDRQWIKSAVGMHIRQTTRSIAICAHAILQTEPLIIPDTTLDPRTSDNPSVTGPMQVRSYVGVPLVTADGHALGTLCVFDTEARVFTPAEIETLTVLARQATSQIELRRTRQQLSERSREAHHLLVRLRKEMSENTRLSQVARHTNNAVIVTDTMGRVEWVNEGFCRLTGYSANEIIGRKPGNLLQGPKTDAAQRERMREALAAGRGVTVEVVNYAKDGHEYLAEIDIMPLRDTDGALTGFMAIETDVTLAREAARALAESELRFRTLVEGANVIVWEYDSETDRFTYVSPQAAKLGYPIEDWVKPKFWHDHVHPEDRASADDFYREVTRTCTPGRHQYRMVKADGSSIWLEDFSSGERWPDGRVVLRGVFVDMTERKQHEADLLAARVSADDANRAKSEFLANMSHEIRTPLTAILGYADLLRESGDLSKAPVERLHAVDTIRSAGRHLMTVINDILDLSKIESNRMTIERVETSLPNLLVDIESLLRPKTSEKGVDLEIILRTPIPDLVMSDPTRIRQILMNLAGNAVKFTDAGRIEISCGLDEPGRLTIDVTDTGPGMTSDQIDRLFTAFGQADTTVTRRHGGTGLGLTISRKLARLMGGEVELCRSEPGQGSQFRVKLPVTMATGATMVANLRQTSTLVAPSTAAVNLRGRILLAEDGADNQRLISLLLRRAGAEVDIAENGRIALDMITRAEESGRAYDLLVSDMQMPEMDGYSLAWTLRQMGSPLAVVALTAHAMAEDRQRCLTAGCDDYMSKPVDRKILVETCGKWLGKIGGLVETQAARRVNEGLKQDPHGPP